MALTLASSAEYEEFDSKIDVGRTLNILGSISAEVFSLCSVRLMVTGSTRNTLVHVPERLSQIEQRSLFTTHDKVKLCCHSTLYARCTNGEAFV